MVSTAGAPVEYYKFKLLCFSMGLHNSFPKTKKKPLMKMNYVDLLSEQSAHLHIFKT